MAHDTASTPAALADLLARMTPRNLEELLPALLARYAEGVVFRDPIQTLRGRDAFARMNRDHIKAAWQTRGERRSGGGE